VGSIAIFTVCNLAYLPKALVLAKSVREFSGYRLYIFLIDRKIDADLSGFDAELIWIEDLSVPNLAQLAFMYDIIELSTALKPHITLELLRRFDTVVFLDPDTRVYHSIESVLIDVKEHSLVLTPHYTTPQSSHPAESDLGMMRFGSFNLGFFAVRKTPSALSFLEWWSDRCLRLNFMESQFGLSTDQKWVSIAPCLFSDLYVSFHPGYNAAPWNVFERTLSRVGHTVIVNDKYPLIFFHFSNFDHNDPQYLNKRSVSERGEHKQVLLELGLEYSAALNENESPLSNTKYGFDYMSRGEYISPTLRRAYAAVTSELPSGHDPFDSRGPVGAFARRNYLFEKNNTKYKVEGFANLRDANNRRTLKLTYIALKIVLRIVGPNKFYNLSRLMVYLSSFRQNRGLWKL
jgi:hypothetical protein